jgi:ABC-type enterobactin transport system permease subunit
MKVNKIDYIFVNIPGGIVTGLAIYVLARDILSLDNLTSIMIGILGCFIDVLYHAKYDYLSAKVDDLEERINNIEIKK